MEMKHVANAGLSPSSYGLEHHGIRNINIAYWNLGTSQLLEHAVQRREGSFAANGSFVVHTGQFTGRSPKDKFVVRDEITDHTIQWGAVNQPISEAHFDRLYARMLAFWQGHDVYVQDCFVGATDLKVNLLLPLQLDLLVIQAPGQKHGPIEEEPLLPVQSIPRAAA